MKKSFLNRSLMNKRDKLCLSVLLAAALVWQTMPPAVQVHAADTAQTYTYPFQNPKLPLDQRVDDLVSRLTLDEKVAMLHQYEPAVPRLGIAAFRTGTEALHGVSWLGKATVFPQATAFANSWDMKLVNKIGSAVADEARGFHKKDPANVGLSLWAPVVDLQRDPRAGRNAEAYGEDAYLSGQISTAYASGMKGDDPFYLKSIPTLKHFLGYNNEVDRGFSSSSIDPRNMHEYYLNSFKPAIKAGAALSMMPAYNAINEKPAILSPLINDMVKTQWATKDFFVVSDAYDPTGTVNDHHYVQSYPEAIALAIKAGVDSMTDQDKNSGIIIGYIKQALAQGLLTEADIDKAVKNIFHVRFRLGEFDPAENNPYAGIDESAINTPDHQKLALQAAREQLVLLKNEKQALPLSKKANGKVAVIGPLADQVLTDFYSGTFPYSISTLQGIKEKISEQQVAFSRGVDQIALKSVSSKGYVTAAPEGTSALQANADQIGPNQTFDLYDFGWGQSLLRSHANDKYLTNLWGDSHTINSADAPGIQKDAVGTQEWFTYQNYKLEPQSDHTISLYNYQSGHWDTGLTGGKYVSVNSAAPYSLDVLKDSAAGDTEKFEETVVVSGQQDAAAAAAGAQVAIVVVGDEPLLNARETIDRTDITLPPSQEALIEKVASVNPNTIVVVVSSYPMAMPKVQNNPNVKAILYSAHGGEEEGSAIADALFGDYAPAGRLNQTWYSSVNQLPDIMNYDIIKGKRTYQYFDGKPLYPFGYGLTYTNFKYGNLRLSSHEADANEQVEVSVDVTNTGSIASDEVVQLYVHADKSRVIRPSKELKGFQRLNFQPHEKKTVTFTLQVQDLSYWDVTRSKEIVESGIYEIEIGRSSDGIAADGKLNVKGETVPHRDLSVETRAENYDDYSQVTIGEDKETGGNSVQADSGSWIAFKDTDLHGEESGVKVHAASGTGGKLQVHLDDPVHGTLIASLDVPATGGLQSWQSVTANVYGASGLHDIYFSFDGRINVSSLQITEAKPHKDE